MADEPKKILIVIIAGIGDFILASPAMRAIANAYPHASINVLTGTETTPIAGHYPYLDKVWPFPLREFLKNKKNLPEAARVLLALRREKFDLIINLYNVTSKGGAQRMGMLFRAIGAPRRVGLDNFGFGRFLTDKVPADTFNNRHFADAMLEVSRHAGGIPDDRGLEIFPAPGCEISCRDYLQKSPGDKLLIGINPGGNLQTKRWIPERFSELADMLVESRGARILIVGGPGEEHLSNSIIDKMKNTAISLAGRLTIEELTCVISGLDLFITNDSGPMHIAVAADTPLVALFSTGNPNMFAPYHYENKYEIVRYEMKCQPCYKAECDDMGCIKGIHTSQVFAAAEKLLDRFSSS